VGLEKMSKNVIAACCTLHTPAYEQKKKTKEKGKTKMIHE